MKSCRKELNSIFSRLPSVHLLQKQPIIKDLKCFYEDQKIDYTIRKVLQNNRAKLLYHPNILDTCNINQITEEIIAYLDDENPEPNGRIINATDVLFNPRASKSCLSEVERQASELELRVGTYHDNDQNTQLIRKLTGGEDSLVVDSVQNALLLATRAIAKDKDILINRHQLGLIDAPYEEKPVDPISICELAGARVVEVGTTNKVRISDYESNINCSTALIAIIRPSTYSVEGFTQDVGLEEIINNSFKPDTTILYMPGDTTLRHTPLAMFSAPYSVSEAIRYGIQLVIIPGGGLIGGPPCGILVGNRQIMKQIKENQYCSAMQASPHIRAALESRLRDLVSCQSDLQNHSANYILNVTPKDVEIRAQELLDSLSGIEKQDVSRVILEKPMYLTPYRLPQDRMFGLAVSIRTKKLRPKDVAMRWISGDPPLLVDYNQDELLIQMRGLAKKDLPKVIKILKENV